MKTNAWYFLILSLFPLLAFTAVYRYHDRNQQTDWPAVIDVQASLSGNQLLLTWKSTHESAELIYVVEVSEDGNEYRKLGIVLGGFRKGNHFEYRFKATLGMANNCCFRIVQERKDLFVLAARGKF